jgi:Type IV secretion-system coupling protein DNA-binding domain
MPSPDRHIEGELGLHAPVEHLVHWLMGAAAAGAVGLILGSLAARMMRGRGLHWSWAAGCFALIVLFGSRLGVPTLMLSVAALFAARRGRRWHREDVDAGSDLAALADARRGPLALALQLLRVAALGVRDKRSSRQWTRGEELTLGLDDSRRSVSIPFGGRSGGRHTLVVGATGSGKTVTQTWIAARAIELGMGAIVIDPKGDDHMHEELRRGALVADRQFLEWTPDGGCVYNPFARGGASEIADKALAGEHFTEPHYQRQAQRYLGYVARALHQSGVEVSLRAIVEHMDPERLEALARKLPENEASAAFTYLDSLSARQRGELAGVRDRLAILSESDVGPWLDPDTPCADRLDLLGAVRRRAIVYFNLESDRRPLLAQMLGAAIVQDLQTAVATLQGSPIPTLVVIDEFSAVAAEQVVRLFGRARSAGFSLLLGTQELSDLRPPGRERMLDQVLGNLSVLIAHRQVVPGSAELVASVSGTTGAWRVSRRSDGATTRVRTREQVLDANQVLGLGRGWGAVLVLGESRSARIAHMFSPRREA